MKWVKLIDLNTAENNKYTKCLKIVLIPVLGMTRCSNTSLEDFTSRQNLVAWKNQGHNCLTLVIGRQWSHCLVTILRRNLKSVHRTQIPLLQIVWMDKITGRQIHVDTSNSKCRHHFLAKHKKNMNYVSNNAREENNANGYTL